MGILQIDILGTSFTINAKEDSAYLTKLLDYYKQIIKQINNTIHTKDSTQTAILAGIMICDELYKEKIKNYKLSNQIDTATLSETEKIAERIIKKISQVVE